MDPSGDQYQFSKKRPQSAGLAGRKPQEVRTIQFGEADKIPVEQLQSSGGPFVNNKSSSLGSKPALRKGSCSLRSSFFVDQPIPNHRDPQAGGENPLLRKQHEPLIKYHRNATSLANTPFSTAATAPSLRIDDKSPNSPKRTVENILRDAEEGSGGANLRSHIFRAAAQAVRSAATSPGKSSPSKRDDVDRRSRDQLESDEDEFITSRYFSLSRDHGVPSIGIGLRVLMSAFRSSTTTEGTYVAPASFTAQTSAASSSSSVLSGIGMMNDVLEREIQQHLALQKKKREQFMESHQNIWQGTNTSDLSSHHQKFQQLRASEKWSVVHEAFGLDGEDAVVGSAVKMGKASRPVSATLRPTKSREESLISTLRKTPLARPTSATSRPTLASATGAPILTLRQQAPRPSSAPLRRTFTAAASAHSSPAAATQQPQQRAPWLDDRGLIGVSLDPSRTSPARETSPAAASADEGSRFQPASNCSSTPPKRQAASGMVRGGAGFVMYSKSALRQ